MSNKKFWITVSIIIVVALLVCGSLLFTHNEKAKSWGQEMVVELPAGEKLMMAQWHYSNLWYLTEPMDSAYVPTEKVFREKSMYNKLNGTVIFKETR